MLGSSVNCCITMPASTSFNPRTAYREDWRYVDGVEDGVLIPMSSENVDLDRHVDIKFVDGPVTHPVLLSVAAGLRVSTFQRNVWLTNHDADQPRQGYQIQHGEKFAAVHSVIEHPIGPVYVCLCSHIGDGGPSAL